MVIYFVRHGETEWNKRKILQGHKDSSLTLKGRENAEKLGKILRNKNIEIIYTSDLGRCVQTAEIINKYLKVKLIKTKKLRERDFGFLNGRPNKEVEKTLNLSDPNEKAPKGESFNQLKNRIINFIKSLKKKKSEAVLLITHGGALRAIFNRDTQSDRVYKISQM